MKRMKKVLAATLAATMVMASAMSVCAATPTPKPGSGSSSSSSSTESTSTVSAEVAAATFTENAPVIVGGKVVQTSVAGFYGAKTVEGCAINLSTEDIKAALNLGNGEKPAVVIYDTDQKKSSAAMASVNAAIEALGGGKMVASLNIDLGARKDGKWVELKDGSVAMKTGLPKDADTTKTYVVICVQPGGATTVLEDQDTNPATVTFAVQAGLGTYALVAK